VRPGCAADHSPPSSAAVMEEWSYNSTHSLGHAGPVTGKLYLLLCFLDISKLSITQVGPEKGVTHLATAAIINALWDLWARVQQKPLWKLLVDMEPEQLVSTIDFRYM